MRTIVHTAMDPALHMLTPHNVRFRDQFYAVDEGKRPVKESFSTPECALCLLHTFAASASLYYSFKSRWLLITYSLLLAAAVCFVIVPHWQGHHVFCPLGEILSASAFNPALTAKVRQHLISSRPCNANGFTCCLQSQHRMDCSA